MKNLNKGIGIAALWIFNIFVLYSDKLTNDYAAWVITGSLIATAVVFDND